MSSKHKKSSLNTPVTLKKGIMTQQAQKNLSFSPSIGVLKKSKTKDQQSIGSGKQSMESLSELPTSLPNLPKRILKSIRKAHNRETLQSRLTLSTMNNHPTLPQLFKPSRFKLDPTQMNDQLIKHNLTQKAILRCKSPQASSLFSRSTTFFGAESQDQTNSYHPLQHMDVSVFLTESARNRLKRLFNKLDTDKDGHLLYTQMQRCLPSIFSRAQLTFFRVLYDVISCGTYFGLQEFYATAIIVEIIAKQDSRLWNILLNDVDFNFYHNSIVELIQDFNEKCASNAGTISFDQLLDLVRKRTNNTKPERISKELENIIPNIKTMQINRLDFISLLPAIIYIESNLNTGRSLFRFQENSLLDSYMRQALLSS